MHPRALRDRRLRCPWAVLLAGLLWVGCSDLDVVRALASAGYPPAQFRLGSMYLDGVGVPASEADALHWFRRAARGDWLEAQFYAGMILARSDDPEELAEGVGWLRVASAAGARDAFARLGELHLAGRGVPRDRAEGLRLIETAAREGDHESQNNLGVFALRDASRADDPTEATRRTDDATAWFRRAADEGFAPAQLNLGRVLLDQGDAEGGLAWIRRAALQGHAPAIDALVALEPGQSSSTR